MKKAKMEAGDRFGRLVIVSELEPAINPSGKATRMFLAKCDCGNETKARIQHLRSGRIRSCGCLHDEFHITHAKSKTREYRIWVGIKSRCNNPKNRAYADYGLRGVSLSDKWAKSFDQFYADMGDCPEGMSIDRVNNDGNYEKSNCRWATRHEQSRNTSRNINITFDGITLTLMDWAKRLNVPYYRLRNRIKELGWSIDRAFTEGVSQNRRIV